VTLSLEDDHLRGRSAPEESLPGHCPDVERCLAPTLKRNDIVMMDILPAHKVAGVREAVGARGATLRQYSPGLNPIEMSFSRLNAHLRKAGERTIPRLRRRLGWFARNVTAREAANHFTYAAIGSSSF
jgi:transposase